MSYVFYALAIGSAFIASLVWRTNGRKAIVAVLAFALASVTFVGTGVANATPLPAHHTHNTESTFGCTAGAIGVGLAWIGVGATAITAEAHGGILTALASGQAGAATAGWAASCPNMARSMLGLHRWIWTHSGCIKVRVAAMHDMPISFCWHNVGSFRWWAAWMSSRTRALAVAMYEGKL